MAKLFIATPMYGGQCAGHYTQSILQLQGLCQQSRIDMAVSFMFNESLITRARNSLAHGFLKSGFTHLMFIDADIRFNPNDVIAMLLADKEVIAGIYPKKEINWDMVKQAVEAGIPVDQLKYYSGTHVVNLADRSGYAEFEVSTPSEILNAGTGFMLIKREVFEKLNQHPAVKPFSNDIGLPKELDPHMKTYFDTAVREGRYYSEDWTFCENWRDLGGQIWVDRRILLRHVGTYTFDFNTHEKLYHDLHELYVNNGLPRTMPPPQMPAQLSQQPTPHQLAAEPAPKVETKVLASSKGKGKKEAKAA